LDGSLRWGRTLDDEVYQAAFPDLVVTLRRKPEPAGGESYTLNIYDETGESVEEIPDTVFGEDPFAETHLARMRQLLGETFERARQSYSPARYVDKLLKSLTS
jgi:hypothetical protein